MVLYYSDIYIFYIKKYGSISEVFQYRSHVLYTKGCKVPNFEPFDPTIAKYYKNVSGDIPCEGKKYVTIKNNIVILDETQVWKDFEDEQFNCTYKPIYRNPKNETSRADKKFGYGKETVLRFNETLPDEFVRVSCKVQGNVTYEDFLASTPLKTSVEERCQSNSAKLNTSDPLNIIIVGIDSISQLNFERHFKLTAEYLRKNLSALEFRGYMKVADNTFPNLTPILTGHFVSRYYNKSVLNRYFDDLDFIWKNFSTIGYRTFLAEDAPDMATYNYAKNGFQYPPTDYFFRPFTLAIEDTPWQMASKKHCFQANPEIVVLFNYLRSFLHTMENRPYFSLTWAARLTHNDLNNAGYADKPAYDLLKDIHDMGYLNRSVLVFLSDHGIRFGDIRKTFIGKIEERMPFLFISFPPWFLDANEKIKSNLISNQRRLTTPFDLHETFVDLYRMMSGDNNYHRTPYGISLFQGIPPDRNCQSAFILPHWCVCHEYVVLHLHDKMALKAASELVNAINKLTKPHRNLCEKLELDLVLDARISKPQEDLLRYKELTDGADEDSITYGKKSDSFEKILITIKTKPGDSEFESTVRKVKSDLKVYDISRINMYGHHGDCINDSDLRKYCQCKAS